jgi:hypothetical protein
VTRLWKSCLLFGLNLLDAQLTVLWVRLDVAREGNALMARILNHSELSFFGAKILVGAFAAYILYRCAHLPIAKHGMTAVLVLYSTLMLVHAATGCVALGWEAPAMVVGYIESLPNSFLSLII